MIRGRDLLWLLAFPFYLVVGTLRHEGSHALGGLWEGARIEWFHFWPRLTADGLLGAFGMVVYDRNTSWITSAAPYVVDLLTFSLCFALCLCVAFRARSVWLNLVILGILSPFVNSLFNYYGGLVGRNDVSWLLHQLPRPLVHGYFVLTLVLYAVGAVVVLLRSTTSRLARSASAPEARGSLFRDLAVATALGVAGIAGEPLGVAAGILMPRADLRQAIAAERCSHSLAKSADRESETTEQRCVAVLEDCRQVLGSTDTFTRGLAMDLARYYATHERLAEAARLYADTLEELRQGLGEGHPAIDDAESGLYGVAESLHHQGEFASAAKWFGKLAESGDVLGQAWLGHLYDNGQGVPQDHARAVHWFTKAAEQGDAESQYRVARLHQQGLGTPADLVAAYVWFKLASAYGERCDDELAACAARMTPEQVARAEQLAASRKLELDQRLQRGVEGPW